MANGLPYYRWYPADAETDHSYAAMTDAELGFFHRLLNRSWINHGLPADLNELAAVMRVKRSYLDKLWANVGKCFVTTDTVKPRLVNPRQEEERTYAMTKSARASDAVRTRYGRRTDALPRAYDCVSVSDSESNSSQKEPIPFLPRTPQLSPPSLRFEDWWALWSSVKGTSNRMKAESAYFRRVTRDNENFAFACTQSYLDGLYDPRKGFNPDSFLDGQALDNFQAVWPRARDSPVNKSRQERMMDEAVEILRREEREGLNG